MTSDKYKDAQFTCIQNISNFETHNCGIGLELQCSNERQKMKVIAIKTVLEA